MQGRKYCNASDRIVLGDDPWSAEYWGDLEPLTEAFRAMLRGDLKTYARYWMNRCKSDDYPKAIQMAGCYEHLLSNIQQGFDPDAWMRSERQYDQSLGYGPISVTIGDDGRIWLRDGSHRSAIVRALGGESVEASVWRRTEHWRSLKDFHRTLYQGYPHPDFASHPILRRNWKREDAVVDYLEDSGVRKAAVVGDCYGAMANALLRVGIDAVAIEPNRQRYALLESWFRRKWPGKCARLSAFDYNNYVRNDATVGLSVYHHVASSLKQWRAVCEKLRHCRLHLVEIPHDHEKQWHVRFREEAEGKPSELLIQTLQAAGNYRNLRTVFVDEQYADRKTVSLER